jgi:Methyltransferase domain
MNHPARRWRDWWRPFRVAAFLLRRPRDVGPYLEYSFNAKGTPLELERPWWSYAATRAVEAAIRPEMAAFEFGSGGSTLFLAKRLRSVACVEDSGDWVTSVADAAVQAKLTNIEMMHRPFDFWQTETFPKSEYLHALCQKYDLIVVDGAEWQDHVRETCFWRAEEYIKAGGVIVLDDSWRYPEVKRRNRAKHWKAYKGCGYCRLGVTETTLFYY